MPFLAFCLVRPGFGAVFGFFVMWKVRERPRALGCRDERTGTLGKNSLSEDSPVYCREELG